MKQNYILAHYLIAGMSHQSKEKLDWWKIDRDTAVELHRERHNPYDPLAISIRLPDGKRLGYLRRDDNKVPSSLMDQGARLEARIVEIRLGDGGEPYELRVEVALAREESV
ncbi:MAG: HIRAN domain-containing protein [Puniceicoccaceae bacterium]